MKVSRIDKNNITAGPGALEWNYLNHSRKQYPTPLYIQIDPNELFESKPIYYSTPSDIEYGHLGLNDLLRTRMNYALKDDIKTTIVAVTKPNIKEITFKISLRSSKNTYSIHETILKEKLLNHFKTFYFSNNQYLLFYLADIKEYMVIHVNSNSAGLIDENTNINLTSTDLNLTVINSKFLKKELFQDNYNFQELNIGGLNKELITIFRRVFSLLAVDPSIIEKLGVEYVKGILLYGLPGCGKTLIARNLSNLISHVPPKIVNGPEVLNKYIGQSEENLRNLFADAKLDYETNKQNASVHVIIFDEIDAICRTRGRSSSDSGVGDKLVNQLLTLMDGVNKLPNILIIATTNRKDLIDEALLRPGRIEVHVPIGLPDECGRIEIFNIHTNKMRNNKMVRELDLPKLASLTTNFTGAEIEAVVKNAATKAIYKNLNLREKPLVSPDRSESSSDLNSSDLNKYPEDVIVTFQHFIEAINEINPAYGSVKNINKLLPSNYDDRHEAIYNKIKNLNSVLLTGKSGVGKTVLAVKTALEHSVFTRLIRPIDLISFDENGKANYIIDIFFQASSVKKSTIIIDELELIINYARLGSVITFSNKILQSILSLLKNDKNIQIILICNVPNVIELLEEYVEMVANLDTL